MNRETLSEAPIFITCQFCHQQVEGSHLKETSVQYSCVNHLPLRIQIHCNRRTQGEWYFDNMGIFIPQHFQLYWNIRAGNKFRLAEWRTDNNFINTYWDLSGPLSHITFPSEWVLSQSAERILKILQMFKVFS